MPSLTLTDPDMILPYDGNERESSTPSPPSQLVYLSNLNARYSADHASSSLGASGNRTKKKFSRQAWTHEDLNVTNPRRLSDIGEELSPARSGGFEEEEEFEQGMTPDAKDNAAWSSSSSTVSAGSARVSGDIASPQTVREVSPPIQEEKQKEATNAGLNKENEKPQDIMSPETKAIVTSSPIASAAATGKGPGEDFASAILSSEAERILENAKKRLTLMEGNLNRARSSVRLTPSPSPSAPGNIQPLGAHQPAGGLYRSISRTDRRGSLLRRQSYVASQDASTNRHSRVHSDTNFPPESSLTGDTKKPSRSVSAMGASSSSFHNDERSFRYEPTRAYLTHRSSVSSIKGPRVVESPQPVRSPPPMDSPVPEEDNSPSHSPMGLGISADDESKSTPGDFSPVYSSYGPPSRAQSQLQVRDLQYQMKGLHIKISSLKVRTQEDNLRRRSLQSLRTPSPLTAADPWYSNGLEMRDGRSSRGSTAIRDGSSEYARDARGLNEHLAPVHHTYERRNSGRAEESPVDHNRRSLGKAPESWHDAQSQSNNYHDGRESVAETMYEDAEEGDFDDGDIDRAALDEILREPLDEDLESLDQFPTGNVDTRPHEEREDAFDYEHFILHSALGNYSRHVRHASQSSKGSVETTRPTRSVRHSRTNSAMSVSTVATFATAIEGEPITEEEEDLLYWDRRFNHGMLYPSFVWTRNSSLHLLELRHQQSHSRQTNPIIETDRSQTPRGVREESATPVQGQYFMNGRSSSATAGSATPTSLVSSLVSTVRAASSPYPGSVTPTSAGGINDDDTQMLEQLFASLGQRLHGSSGHYNIS
ncbi:uncharacterized protein N7483_011200 [Penicillium malachiteum]|uniref:uncharacterized protein n=1 Tax=Penicillium malachiteum TaxID=1324776 RepID=UPI002548C46B|nr:uncharacterized protein N7483_011200 [Penicillium malachiteum]KAJ5714019.1 hypothetical protein N7483_011200 [Penicillium malachiteum]